jgi:TolB-like protein/AraC-like DNA-binding protein/Tfp pilus assembly protein PilF
MNDLSKSDREFLEKITGLIRDRIADERFGVSELATEAGMSRSNLLRKVKRITGLSVSQFIRNIRLESAMEILRTSSSTVSEVSYQVGFGSTSYFVKCFHEKYGYPPGEISRGTGAVNEEKKSGRGRPGKIAVILVASLIIITGLVLVINNVAGKDRHREKSIAVLPFINDSDDSTNVYFVNGLMEAILNNLQKIEDLRVVSRTSVEKYRKEARTIREIGKELDVRYVIEGSGQKAGDVIMLNVQLIDADNDRHLWSEQYRKELTDIFNLQGDVARSIAGRVEATITPEEEVRIDKIPTQNLVAYDYFLRGMEKFNSGTPEGLREAIALFEKAIEQDNEYARAYADISLSYSLLEMYQAEKQYSDLVNAYADKALLYDPELAQSLVAKAVYYLGTQEYEKAVPYLEKALKYNPNSALVLNILSDYYTSYDPDTEKYLEYALKGTGIDIGANDSSETSFLYLHIANSFLQTGFVDEAEKYIQKSLDFDPANLYSQYVSEYVRYATDGDLQELRKGLADVLEKDPSRYDILQELAKTDYFLRNYESADTLFTEFLEIKDSLNIDVYSGEDAKIAWIYEKVGKNNEAEALIEKYGRFAENDRSLYRNLNLSVYYSLKGDTGKAIEYFDKFSRETRFNYLFIPFLKIDPLMENLRDNPDYGRSMKRLEDGFNDYHKKIRRTLKKKDLI